MKRLRTKVVASIVAVLILFCSLPMGNVIALGTTPSNGTTITFSANSAINYYDVNTQEDGYYYSFEELLNPTYKEELESSYGYSIEKDRDNNYKVTFNNYKKSQFPFIITKNNDDVTIKVKAQYSSTSESEITINPSGYYSFQFSKMSSGENSAKVSVETINPTYLVTAPSDQTGYTFAPDSKFDNMESDTEGNFEFSITSQIGYKKPEVRVTGGTLETNNQEVNLDVGTKFDYKITGINKNVTIRYTGGKQTYTVDFNNETGYDFHTTTGSNTIEHGGSLTFYVIPDDGYKSITKDDIQVKKADGSSVAAGSVTSPSNNQFLLTGVKENVKLYLSNTGMQTYTVTAPTTVTGYTFDFDSNSGYNSWESHTDGTFKFTVTAATGYKEPTVNVSSGTIQKEGDSSVTDGGTKYTYSVSGIKQNITITCTGGKETYKVKFAEEIIGYNLYSASSDNSTTVEYGNSFSFYVVPKDGYKAVTESNITVQKTGKEETSNSTVRSLGNNQYQLLNVTEDVTISVNGAEQTYTITLPSSKTEYSVSVDSQDDVSGQNGSYTIKYNKSFSFKVTLKEGYTDSSIVVSANNKELSEDEGSFDDNTKKYTISNVTADQTITISGVSKNVYSVEYVSIGQGYTLTTTDPTSQVSHGTKLKFTLTLKDGYKADSIPTVNVAGVSTENVQVTKESDTVYSVTVTVKNNITGFTVSGITEKKYKVVFESETGFTVSDENGERENIAHGATYSFKVSAKSGYRLVSVAVSTKGGNDKTQLNPINDTYYINNINTDKTITVILEKVTLTVTYNDSLNSENPETIVTYTVDGVKVNGSDDTDSKYGSVDTSSGTVTLAGEPGKKYGECYKFDGWFDNGNSDKKGATIDLGNADASLTLTAKWTPDWSQIFTLQWDGDANTIKDAKLTIKYGPGVLEDKVPILEDAQITKMGVYYTNDSTALNDDAKLQTLKEYFVDGGRITETKSVRQIIPNSDKSVVLYVYVTSYNDITYWKSFEQSFTGVTTDRYAVGWIELTLKDGSKQYIYTDLETINANQE